MATLTVGTERIYTYKGDCSEGSPAHSGQLCIIVSSDLNKQNWPELPRYRVRFAEGLLAQADFDELERLPRATMPTQKAAYFASLTPAQKAAWRDSPERAKLLESRRERSSRERL